MPLEIVNGLTGKNKPITEDQGLADRCSIQVSYGGTYKKGEAERLVTHSSLASTVGITHPFVDPLRQDMNSKNVCQGKNGTTYDRTHKDNI